MSASRILPFAFALSLAAVPALAQQRPPPPTRQPTLADRLNLRPDQDAAFRTYSDELALERSDAAHAQGQVERLNAMTTPQRLDWSLAQLPKQQASARRAAQATRTFYAALDSEQQRTFDRLTQVRSPGGAQGPAPGGRSSQPRSTLPTPPAGAPLPRPTGSGGA